MEESLLETPGTINDSAIKTQARNLQRPVMGSARKILFSSLQSPPTEVLFSSIKSSTSPSHTLSPKELIKNRSAKVFKQNEGA